MILGRLLVGPSELARVTGWQVKPEGACKGERCVPLAPKPNGYVDVRELAATLGMPLVRDDETGLHALGPESGGRPLESAEAPPLELPDLDGRPFRLDALRGTKVLLVAWASW